MTFSEFKIESSLKPDCNIYYSPVSLVFDFIVHSI